MNQKSRITKSLKSLKDVLLKTNTFPEDEKKDWRIHYFNLMKIFILTAPPTVLGLMGYIYKSGEERNPDGLIDGLVGITTVTFFSILIFISFSRLPRFFEFFEKSEDFEFGIPPNFEESLASVKKLVTSAGFIIRILVVLELIILYSSNSFCTDHEKEQNVGTVCGSIWPMWFPFKINEVFRHYVILCSFAITFKYFPIFSSIFISYFGCFYLVLKRIQHIREILNDLINSDSRTDEKMLVCFKYHQRVVELMESLKNFMGHAVSSICIILPLLLAMCAYQFIVFKNFVGLSNLVGFMTAASIVCLIGQYLQNESELLTQTAYEVPWHEMSVKQQKNWKMFLFQLQKPIQLELDFLPPVNNELLLMIMKSFYSFLMFLIQMYKK